MLAALVLGARGAVHAQGPPAITVDELGGSISFAPGTTSLPFTVAVDPLSGISTLTYTLPFPVIPGDVLLFNPADAPSGGGQPQPQSDLIRFYASDDAIGGLPALVFFSDKGDIATSPPSLADVGLPPFGPVVVVGETGPDDANGAFYLPGPTDPGFSPTFAMSYHFVSDGTVPEPSSVMLFALGAAGLAIAARCRRRG